MDEHDLRNCVFVSFSVNMQIMSALSVQGSNEEFCFLPETKMQEK